jgi:hypothetical protein
VPWGEVIRACYGRRDAAAAAGGLDDDCDEEEDEADLEEFDIDDDIDGGGHQSD